MFMNKTKVLLVLTQDVLDRARVLAGKATAALKLPVSLQIASGPSSRWGSSRRIARLSSRTLGTRPRRFASSGARRVEQS